MFAARCLVAVGALLLLLHDAASQMSPPLQGQGIDPYSAGYTDGPVPVYVSVELSKLVNLDEKKYQLQALLVFYQAWSDPRSSNAFSIIQTAANQQQAAYDAAKRCAASGDSSGNVNLTSPDCQAATTSAPSCTKYCSMYGSASSNPYQCCDLIWLPDVTLRNLIDTSQDRVVQDTIFGFSDNGVYRQTSVNARFYTSLNFHDYPFDRQRLQIFVDANNLSDENGDPTYFIVPSAAFRQLNQQLSPGTSRSGDVTGLDKDELAGWNIDNVAFSCANGSGSTAGSKNRPLSIATQDFAPDDAYEKYYTATYGQKINPSNAVDQTCALTVDLSRLSNTATVQSILPVAFTSALAFVVFFTAPDAIDVRLGTEITLFLALTAVQFIFTDVLPTTSYLTDFDVFILLSYCLIVVIVLENLVVCWICTREEHHERKGSLKVSTSEEEAEEEEGGDEDARPPTKEEQEVKHARARVGLFIPFSKGDEFAKDPAYAYRLACWVDMIAGILLLVAYIILSVLCFTVGLQG